MGAVDLMWAQSFTAVKYHVLRSTTAGSGYAEIASTTGTTYHDASAQGGTTDYYVVAAENADGAVSAFSTEATAAPGGLANFGFAAAWGGGFDGLEDVAASARAACTRPRASAAAAACGRSRRPGRWSGR